MKLDIPQVASRQTAIRIPEDHWQIIGSFAKENNCDKSDVIRLMVKEFIQTHKLTSPNPNMNTEQKIREEERAKCRALLEECKEAIIKKGIDVVNQSNQHTDALSMSHGFNKGLSTCISILEDKLK